MGLHLDPEGKFVVLHAVIGNVSMVVVGLYIPPPASLSLLNKITQIIANFSIDNIVLARDFNLQMSGDGKIPFREAIPVSLLHMQPCHVLILSMSAALS